ncbi:hypothetical protein ES288_A08G271000v1 [Gossypium darwinii]|uniref:Rad21/Rec8-like protein N-terminal domain-containing protein n=1 Tax=Gossypium darwinii TaxID=34276 RepID=A0A5D2FQX6_GOSDA|nr:hypothetical protein ES288_A08G271000v1 [Gossypium darwinii]
MFYSQFILAKKGPLGTIWIAAHLERKLRKNQVADTDIGVSVDSILFPDVPIALRLSSHLLLGVVRIYSRKVNYLFDDCSEALLKIKQAFRSTAVDLPPEESTAPYHSITLPETFDLDDFELPDNEIFQGNYVDHHVSSREQITLQDTMDGVVYSTSQFGLDERFGDGDTSQIGLLDEELVLDRVASSKHAGVSEYDPQGSDVPQEQVPSNSEAMPMDCSGDQVEDLAANSEFIDYDQDPGTPGLVEVPNLSGVHEALAGGDHAEPEHDNLTELANSKCVENASNKSNLHHEDNKPLDQSLENEINHDAVVIEPPENDCHISDMEKEQTKPQESSLPDAVSVECASAVGTVRGPDGSDRVEEMHNGGMHSIDRTDRECAESPSCSNVTFDLDEPARRTSSNSTCVPVSDGNLENDQALQKFEFENEAEATGNLEESHGKAIASNPSCPLESPSRPTVIDGEAQAFQEPNVSENPKETGIHEEVSSVQVLGSNNLAAAEQNSVDLSQREEEVHASGAPIEVQGEVCQTQMVEPAFCGHQLENSNSCAMSDLPAPERLLSALEELLDKPSDLLVESTPDKEVLAGNDEIDAGTKLISGKKRSLTESTLTVESINSVESFGRPQSMRTAESVPDDDDLLSSILVGRKSSVFKMKPTPQFEVASRKRTRSAAKPSATKRKVLMDDTMVLHGDTIRQQLVNTEDIRRIRKKAPCTRSEISLIQRRFLEDEIFSESVLTGMSGDLTRLHSEQYDLSSIRISEGDQNHASNEVAKDSGCSVRPDIAEGGIEGSSVPLSNGNDEQAQSVGITVHTKTQQGEYSDLNEGTTVHTETQQGEHSDLNSQQDRNPVDGITEMEIDKDNAEAVNASNHFVLNEFGVSSPTNLGTEFLLEESKANTSADGSIAECFAPIENGTNSLVTLQTGESVNGSQNAYEAENDKVDVIDEAQVEVALLDHDDKDPIRKDIEECKMDSTYSENVDVVLNNASLNMGETSTFQEVDAVNKEMTSLVDNQAEFEDVAIGNDTEFLNVDDDELGEDDDNGMPGGDESRLLENSGWSSRTRAVAKYLQNLFEDEAVHGRKALSMDSLLARKTRKEASRMFFETLVLKTKDYIHVEQGKPFDDICIKPRLKLLKSDF